MKRILFLAAATFAICLMTTASHAQAEQLKLRFHIPCPFTVENTTFAAGEYEVTEPAHLILEVRNVREPGRGFEHATPAESARKQTDGLNTFHRYGSEYFLAAVSDGSYQSTHDLRLSKKRSDLRTQVQRPQLKVVSIFSQQDRSACQRRTGVALRWFFGSRCIPQQHKSGAIQAFCFVARRCCIHSTAFGNSEVIHGCRKPNLLTRPKGVFMKNN